MTSSSGIKEERTSCVKNGELFSIYSKPEKILVAALVSVAASFSGFASNIYFPALPTIAEDLAVSNELVNLTVTTYMIFQGIAPTFWGAMADVHGRRLVYIGTLAVFLTACIVLANTKNYATLIVVRCLQSSGSASTIALGAGVIGDITVRSERGGYMAMFLTGSLVPVAIGPIIGGTLSKSLGWRWVFWILAIYCGAFMLILILILPETLRYLVGNGSTKVEGFKKFPLVFYQLRYQKRSGIKIHEPDSSQAHTNKVSLLGPLKIFCDQKVLFVITFLSLHYTVWQMSITILSSLFKTIYGLDETKIGLTFIANGIGSILGTLLTGKILNFDYKNYQAKHADRPVVIRHVRLRTVWIWSGMQIASIIVFGWTLQKRVHISVPIIATFFTGWGAVAIQSVVSTYLVDLYENKSASATAALNLARCLLGAGGTAVVTPLLDAISIGWGFTLLAAVLLAVLTANLLHLYLKKAEQNNKEVE
ncbi:LAFA_0C10594g1_1 [Lachancea sp. 'fantastica']|nr:LAFA_0C10594g1_1 [Lachancea sp. 'fantastica']